MTAKGRGGRYLGSEQAGYNLKQGKKRNGKNRNETNEIKNRESDIQVQGPGPGFRSEYIGR